MEDIVFQKIRSMIECVANRRADVVYDTHTILLVGMWAILKDRPFSWACHKTNWPESLRPSDLPDQSTLSRRWRCPEIRNALKQLNRMMVQAFGPLGRDAAVDGRPLVVGAATKDPDAQRGGAVRGMGRGYKLHALVTRGGVMAAFQVLPMNEAEQNVAVELIQDAAPSIKRVTGDTIFDSVNLHKVANKTRRRLYTPLRQNRVGRRKQPARLRLFRINQTPAGRAMLKARDHIERHFARMSNLSFGFKGLPAWVRRVHRVQAWVTGKIIAYHAYLLTILATKETLRA